MMSTTCGRLQNPRQKTPFTLLAALFPLVLIAGTPIPAPEKLLPDDTLLVLTAPDFSKVREIFQRSPQGLLWNDPIMKPFRDKLVSKWEEEFVKPLERELNVSFDSYSSLPQGQLTFAVTQNGWRGDNDQAPAFLLMLDAKSKSSQLKTNLANLRKQWADNGRTMRMEKIRDIEFTILLMSSNDVPKTLRKFFPKQLEVQELGDKEPAPKTPAKNELVLGQVDSLLLLGNSTKAVERVVARLTGSASPVLADLAAYQANHQALFRDSPLYGWVNAKVFVDILSAKSDETKENPQAPNPFEVVKPEKIIGATGLAGLRTLALSFQDSGEGSFFQLFLGVPEANRQGIFKIIAGEAKESSPPPFVPADAVKFQRWRIDGQKTWDLLEKIAGEVSPKMLSGLNLILDTANAAARQQDPGFDVRKNLIGNLGDDIITYGKAARGNSPAELNSPPSLLLIGSPGPDQLAAALKSVFVFLSQQAGTPAEREFLGRKIYSIPLPPLPPPLAGTSKPAAPRTLSYAASSGYLALSTDTALLEEYLRSSDSQGKALRETPGFAEAAQKVIGPGSGMFSYENQVETMRAMFDTLRKDPTSATNPANASALPGALGLSDPEEPFKTWLDISLLPSFDKVARYFYFTVSSAGANVDGLTWKVFAPVPPQLKHPDAAVPKR